MSFNGFSKKGIKLLDNIVKNNSKEYLEANRDLYEKYILAPNKAYVQEMGEYLQIIEPSIIAEPKINKSLFKIYRDHRFHPFDPIKEKIGIIFWKSSTHRMQSTSFYMHYNSFEYFLATGIRNFKPPLLKKYREYIKDDKKREELHYILEELKEKGFLIPEPHYKKIPNCFEKDISFSYLTKYRAIYVYKEYPLDDIFFSKTIIERNFNFYKESKKLFDWLYQLTIS